MVAFSEYLRERTLMNDVLFSLVEERKQTVNHEQQVSCQDDINFAFQADCVTDTPSIEPT